MTNEERDNIIDKLAQYNTDNCDMSDLMNFFYDGLINYYNELSDSDLLVEIAEKEENDPDWDKTL